MTSGELAALITAIGVSLAGIITAIAALKNSNANAQRFAELTKENEKLHAELDDKTEHNDQQDAIILNQQIRIDKYQIAFDRMGRKMNQMQLQIGQYQYSHHETGPLPRLPDEKDDD
jgi:hypothetical protein